jgi:hypothetical protein
MPTKARAGRLSRREFLAAGGSSLLGAYLLACGDGDGASDPTATGAVTQPSPRTEPGAMRWRRIEPSGETPPPRRDHALVGDDQQLFLFGGRSADPMADLWSYDVASNAWTQAASEGGPSARFGHNAGWDGNRRRLIVFGGQAGGATFFNDTWEFDPASLTWTQLDAGDVAPNPRYGAGGTLDMTGRLIITHGFTNDGRFNDTWGLLGGSWSNITPAGDKPVERCLMRAVWDEVRQRILIFGGQTNETPFLDDLWAAGPSGWARLNRTPHPSARTFYAMVQDNTINRTILFGGNTEDGPVNDVWVFDSEDEFWTQLTIDGDAPGPRQGHDAVWLHETGRMLTFGGRGDGQDLNELWELAPVES